MTDETEKEAGMSSSEEIEDAVSSSSGDGSDGGPRETALRDSLQHLRALFDSTLDALLLADDQARFVEANPAASDITGYDREELLAMSVWDLTPAASREEWTHLWQIFITQKPLKNTSTGEHRILRKDGTVVESELRTISNNTPPAPTTPTLPPPHRTH